MERGSVAQCITRDTHLRISSWNSAAGVTIQVTLRRLEDDGELVVDLFEHVPNTDRTRKQTTHALYDARLVSVQAVVTAGTPVRGQTFVRVELIEGLTGAIVSSSTLLQNYITPNVAASWPGASLLSPLDGAGFMRVVTGTDPAAGAEISETVPAGVRWRLIGFRVVFVTSAVVANRIVSLTIDDGATVGSAALATINQAASLTFTYFAGDYGVNLGASQAFVSLLLPGTIPLVAGYRIRSVTANLDGADNFGAPQYLVEEWFDV